MNQYEESEKRYKILAAFSLAIIALSSLNLVNNYFNEQNSKNQQLIASKIEQTISENPTASEGYIYETNNNDDNDKKNDEKLSDTLK